MAIVTAEIPAKHARQLRHTSVQARDGRYFKVLTHQLYDREPPPEFQNFEVNVMETDANGKFRELNVPYYRRFFRKDEALAFHQELLDTFDAVLEIPEPKAHEKKADPKEKEEAAH